MSVSLPTADPAATAAIASNAFNSLTNQEAVKKLIALATASAGVGMAGRGLIGLYNTGRRNVAGPKVLARGPKIIEVPYPEDREKTAANPFTGYGPDIWNKIQEWRAGGPGASVPSVPAAAPSQPTDILASLGKAIAHPLNFLQGNDASKITGKPWFAPAAVAAIAAGGYGGYKLSDKLLDNQRKKNLDSELEQARKEYDEALLAQYGSRKTAACKLGQELDSLYDDMQKASSDVPGQAAGAVLGVGTLAGLITMATVYDAMKKRQESAVMQSAQKKRLRQHQMSMPLPLVAMPVAK